jgi:hypothetical protein
MKMLKLKLIKSNRIYAVANAVVEPGDSTCDCDDPECGWRDNAILWVLLADGKVVNLSFARSRAREVGERLLTA